MDPPGPASDSSGRVSGAVDVGELAQMLSGQTWQNRVAILDAAMPAPGLDGGLTSSPRVQHSPLARQLRDEVITVALSDDPGCGGGREPFQRSLHPLTPETAVDVEDPQAVESLVVHGALSSGTLSVVLRWSGPAYNSPQGRCLPLPSGFPPLFLLLR